MNILLIDNYDSFTYNLLHYLEEASDTKVEVLRNDEIEGVDTSDYTHIVISPGPGLPKESGQLIDFIQANLHKKILGICLGQQALAEVFGMKLKQLDTVVHGQATTIEILDADEPLFLGLPKKFKVGRYHSWVVDPKTINGKISITTKDEKGELMGIRHFQKDISAVQFHPESILTEHGKQMIANWLNF